MAWLAIKLASVCRSGTLRIPGIELFSKVPRKGTWMCSVTIMVVWIPSAVPVIFLLHSLMKISTVERVGKRRTLPVPGCQQVAQKAFILNANVEIHFEIVFIDIFQRLASRCS